MKFLYRTITNTIRRLGYDIVFHKCNPDHFKCISLSPNSRVRGRVLLAYILRPFLGRNVDSLNSHTHYWESFQIAQTYLSMGYCVDVTDYRNHAFFPKYPYDLFISARSNFSTLATRLNTSCYKVVHLDTAHWVFNNQAVYSRHLNFQRRQGTTVKVRKLFNQTWAIEHADCAVLIGNEKTEETYHYSGKPVFTVPVPTCRTFSFPVKKNFENARYTYLWMGSDGLVNKGLDLVLEVFADLPTYKLHVCGPIDQEKDFVTVYEQHLFRSDNIKTHGWVDVTSKKFIDISNDCIALIYPSCSEGQAGVVATCMQAGLLPIVSIESGFSPNNFGVYLSACTKEEIKKAVIGLSEIPPDLLLKKSRDTWKFATKVHSRNNYKKVYGKIAETIINELMPEKDKRE